jgi:hypothetical protein
MTATKIVVKKFKGDRALERGLNRMAERGYEVQSQATRKAAYSAVTGVFTRKQIHTVTFRRQPPSAVPAVAQDAQQGVAQAPPSTTKRWFQEATMRDVLQGRAERRANREQAKAARA